MAMYFTQGTLNPASTTKADDIRNAWVSAFAGQPNWSVVDDGYTLTTGKRTVITNDTNGFAIMLLTSTVTTDLTLNIYLGQSYTLATHTLNNVAFLRNTTSTLAIAGNNGYSGTNYNPTAISISATVPVNHGSANYILATAGQTDWSAHIESDHAILSFKDGAASKGRYVYFGNMNSLVTAGDTTGKDAVIFNNAIGASQNVGILNSFGNAGTTTYHGGTAFTLPDIGTPTNSYYKDKYRNATDATGSPIFIARNAATLQTLTATASEASVYGWLRGSLKSSFVADDGIANWGDTVVVGTTTYMYIGGITTTSVIDLAYWVAVN